MLTGGFYLNTTSFPKGAEWLTYVSYVYYSFAALVINEFTGLKFSCPPGGAPGCVRTGEQVIRNLGLEDMSIYLALGCLAILTGGFLSFAYIGLLFFRDRYLRMESLQHGKASDKAKAKAALVMPRHSGDESL